jgi:cytochrome o ubiquinol oxidase operon protein cyoD
MTQESPSHVRRRYLTGYFWALGLTLAAFAIVASGSMSKLMTTAVIAVTALLQIAIHLRYFLHLDFSQSRREDLLLVLFAVLLITLMVGGSLWIMSDLHRRMM